MLMKNNAAGTDYHNDKQRYKYIERLHIREEFSGIVHTLKQRTCDTAAETNHTSCGKVTARGDNTARQVQ